MEHPEEPATEAEPEGIGRLRFEGKARIVKRQFLQGGPQIVELVIGCGEKSAEHDRHGLLVTGQGDLRRAGDLRDGIADVDVGQALDIGDDVTDLADAQFLAGDLAGPEPAEAGDFILGAIGHVADLLPDPERAVDDPDVGDHPLVIVELGVEDQGAEGCFGIARGGWDPLDDRAEDVGDPLAGLGTDGQHLAGIDPQAGQDLFLDGLGPRGLHVDFIEHRDDHQVVSGGQEGIGHGLRLDTLGGVDQQDRPLAGRQAPRHLVMEVDVPRGIDQVQLVDLIVQGVIDRDRPSLDGDPAFALEVHVVEQLLAELARGDRPRLQQELVRQRALAVIDVRDDREVADEPRMRTMVESSTLGSAITAR